MPLHFAPESTLTAMRLPRLERGEGARQLIGVDPTVAAGDRHELETAAEKPGGIGLGGIDVRQRATEDETPGRR
jgi:hypothetical protein